MKPLDKMSADELRDLVAKADEAKVELAKKEAADRAALDAALLKFLRSGKDDSGREWGVWYEVDGEPQLSSFEMIIDQVKLHCETLRQRRSEARKKSKSAAAAMPHERSDDAQG